MATHGHLSPFPDSMIPTGSLDQLDCPMNNLTGELEQVDSRPFARGGYADVYMYRLSPYYLGPYNEKKLFAVKTPRFYVADRRKATARLSREIAIWNSLQHENVLKLHGTLYRKDDVMPSLVSDYMENGTADHYMKHCPEAKLLQMICDVARGLAHLHRKGVAHGDIKANNILVDNDGRGRIADFGLSRMLGGDGRAMEVTTTDGNRISRWHAIEYFNFDESNTSLGPTKPADVWSFGCTVLELFSGEVPFHGVKEAELSFRLAKGERPKFPPFVSRPEFAKYKAAVVAFCHLCWTRNPESRPQMSVLEDLACSDYWDETCDTLETCEQRPPVDPSPERSSPSPSPSLSSSQSPASDSDSSVGAASDDLRSRSASQATLVSSSPTDEGPYLEPPISIVVEAEDDPQPDPALQGTPPVIPDPPPPSLEDLLGTNRLNATVVLYEASRHGNEFNLEFNNGESTGPSHIPTHVMSCMIDNEVYGVGAATGTKAQAKTSAALHALERLYVERPALFTNLSYAPVLTSYLNDNDLSARVTWVRQSGPRTEDSTIWQLEHRASFIFDGNVIATGVGPDPVIAEEDAARRVQVAWTRPNSLGCLTP